MSESRTNLYGVQPNIFINYISKINSLPEITSSTTIYADDVQLLFSGAPEQIKYLQRQVYKYFQS